MKKYGRGACYGRWGPVMIIDFSVGSVGSVADSVFRAGNELLAGMSVVITSGKKNKKILKIMLTVCR